MFFLHGSGDGGGGEEFEGSFGDEVIGYPAAESFGGGRVGRFRVDLDHGFAVGGDDLSEHAPLPCFGCGRNTVRADGEGAAATESVEGSAFGFDGEAGGAVLEEGDGAADVLVAAFVGL